jgi:transposase
MPRRMQLARHLEATELGCRYHCATDPVERTQFHILWLLAQGRSRREVAEVTGYSPRWISAVVKRYNADGPGALCDRRHANPGAAPVLRPDLQHDLRLALHGPAPNGGPWRSRDVSEWIAARIGREVPVQRGWAYLTKLGSRSGRRRSARPNERGTAANLVQRPP